MPELSSSCLLICLLIPVSNPALAKIVWGEFYGNAVALQDLDEVHPHLAGNVSENDVTIFELYAKHCVRQCFVDHPVNFDRSLFRHLYR